MNRVRLVRAAVPLVALVAIVGCASDGDGKRPVTSPPVSESGSASPPVISPRAAASVAATPVAARVQKRFEMSGGPDYVGVGSDAVWVKSDRGLLTRIDPTTNKVTATVAVSDGLCQGLGVRGQELWTCNGGDVVRVDTRTATIVKKVAVDKVDSQGNLAIGFGHVWVLSGALGDKLVSVSSATNAVTATIDLGHSCRDLTIAQASVWVMCAVDGVALEVDPAKQSVVRTVAGLPGVELAAAADGVSGVFASYRDGIALIDTSSGQVTHAVALDADGPRLAVTPGAVWVRGGAGFLLTLDATTLEVRSRIDAPEESGGSVAFGFGSVWTSAFDDDVVYRLRPA